VNREEEIVSRLCGAFPFLTDRICVRQKNRIFTDPITREEFEQIIPFVHDQLGFYRACHVVGTDDGDSIGLLYIFSDQDSILLALRESVPKSDPQAKSICNLYPSIILHEREIIDLFGVMVKGLPNGPHYPLPDGWPEGNYPMRKDWDPKKFNKQTMKYEQSGEAKENG